MKNELAKAHEELSQWCPTADFLAVFDKWNSMIETEDFHGDDGGFIREAWVLAEYVKRVEVERVRLASPGERWPDGYVKIEGQEKCIEITEVLEPWRRRQEEYRDPKPYIEMDPVENWVKRAKAIPAALRKQVAKKAKKRYDSRATLLVYLNISEYGIRQKETEAIIAEVKAEHAAAFEQIVVLWKYQLY